MPDPRQGVDIRLAHCHDLALQSHFHATERRRVGLTFLPFQPVAARQGPDSAQHRVNPVARARNGAVDPLGCQQKRSLYPMGLTFRQQPRLQGGGVGKTGELIKGGDDLHRASLPPTAAIFKRLA